MAFVINEPGIGIEDVSCTAARLYTDPEECIDCDTSVAAGLHYAPTLAGAAGLADAPPAAPRGTAARATERVLRPAVPPGLHEISRSAFGVQATLSGAELARVSSRSAGRWTSASMAQRVSALKNRSMIERACPMNQSHAERAPQLDAESRAWLETLRSDGARYDAAIMRLHALLLSETRYQVRRRTAALAHPSGRDLDDLAMQAADDALVAILGKLDRFRGDALFSTWARRFAELEVPGEIRRRLGHARETPSELETLQVRPASDEDTETITEAADLADRLGELIVHELTSHQREVLVALAIDGVDSKDLATRLDSTPGALYKTLHDARRKLKRGLADPELDDRRASSGPTSKRDRAEARRLAQRMLVCAGA